MSLWLTSATPSRTWNFFIGPSVGTTVTTQLYPDHTDTASYALRVLPTSADVIHSVLDEMLALAGAHPDAIIPVYFPTSSTNGRAATKAYVLGVLAEASFMQDGTRYYSSPPRYWRSLTQRLEWEPGWELKDLIMKTHTSHSAHPLAHSSDICSTSPLTFSPSNAHPSLLAAPSISPSIQRLSMYSDLERRKTTWAGMVEAVYVWTRVLVSDYM